MKDGITLIALVVTIVVLLILAGISIAMLTGDDGIIKNAQKAKKETDIAGEQEIVQLSAIAARDIGTGIIEESDLERELTNHIGGAKGEKYDLSKNGENYTVTFTESGRVYKIDKDGKVTEYVLTINDKMVADDLGVKPTIEPEEMKPVKYDEATKTWVEADPTVKGDWFDYSNKKWANVETENGYFVYVPRYAYKITSGYHQNLTTAGTMAIVFLNGDNTLKSNIDSEGNTVSQSDLVTADQVNSSTANTGINATTKYIIHPAFEAFGNIDGLWVAKYEMSMEKTTDGGVTWNPVNTSDTTIGNVLTNSTIKMVSKPGVGSWRDITVNNIFTNCYNMNRALDSHMMKNTEWGAVAYLTVSKYGKGATSEVEQNKSSSYLTGYGASSTLSTGAASTTGNMYGIFDMSGGTFEYVAGYLEDSCMAEGGSRYSYNESLIKAQPQYKDVYQIGSSNAYATCYTANNLKVGDALWEVTSDTGSNYGWYGDGSNFVGFIDSKHYPVFRRGGSYITESSIVGVFCANNNTGNSFSGSNLGFRSVCVVK